MQNPVCVGMRVKNLNGRTKGTVMRIYGSGTIEVLWDNDRTSYIKVWNVKQIAA